MPYQKQFVQYSTAQTTPITITSATTTTVIPSVTGQTIRILFLVLTQAGNASANNITIELASIGGSPAVTTALSGAMALGSTGTTSSAQGFVVDHHDNPLVLPVGGAFDIITLGSNVALAGYVMYTQGNA